MVSHNSPTFGNISGYLIFLVFQFGFIFVNSGSLDNEIVCEVKWVDGGVLDESVNSDEINKRCFETNMFDDRALAEKLVKNITLEEFIEVDDNCFVQCAYKADKILTPDGSIDKDATERIFKGNLTEPVHTKSVGIWTDCIAEAERIAKEKKADNCKMLSLHDFCFSTRALAAELIKIECSEKPVTLAPN